MSNNTEVEVKKEVAGPVTFGPGSLKKPTPLWATWAFRIYLYGAVLTIIILTVEPRIPALTSLIIIRYLGIGTIVVHMLSKMFGIDISKDEADAKSFLPNK